MFRFNDLDDLEVKRFKIKNVPVLVPDDGDLEHVLCVLHRCSHRGRDCGRDWERIPPDGRRRHCHCPYLKEGSIK